MRSLLPLLPLLGIALTTSAQLPDPLAHYPFNGDAQDISGNDYHGTLMGATFGEDPFGVPASAAVFDGASHVDLSALAVPYRDALAAATVSFWVRFAGDIVDDQTVLSLSAVGEDLATNVHEIEFEHGVWAVETETGASGTNHELAIHSTLMPDTWYLITVTFEGTTLNYYRGGALMASVAYVPAETACASLFLGCYAGNTAQAGQYLTGSVDDLRIFATVLDAGQVAELADVQINVPERAAHGTLNAWPVPSDGQLLIDLSWMAAGTATGIELHDAQGRLMQRTTATAAARAPFTFRNDIPSGAYVLRVRDAQGTAHTRRVNLVR